MMKPEKWDTFRQFMERFRAAEGSVLVIDDNPGMRGHARSILERDGWTVVWAADGSEALHRVTEA